MTRKPGMRRSRALVVSVVTMVPKRPIVRWWSSKVSSPLGRGEQPVAAKRGRRQPAQAQDAVGVMAANEVQRGAAWRQHGHAHAGFAREAKRGGQPVEMLVRLRDGEKGDVVHCPGSYPSAVLLATGLETRRSSDYRGAKTRGSDTGQAADMAEFTLAQEQQDHQGPRPQGRGRRASEIVQSLSLRPRYRGQSALRHLHHRPRQVRADGPRRDHQDQE